MSLSDWLKFIINPVTSTVGEEQSSPDPVDESRFRACVEIDEDGNTVVSVYTPHLGGSNWFNSLDIGLPGDNRVWRLWGYEERPGGDLLAVWQCATFSDPEMASTLINLQHFFRIEANRLFFLGQITDEDREKIEFYVEHIDRLEWR